MNYPTTEEEFYELMDRKREEIDKIHNIPEEVRSKLYLLVQETIERHKRNKSNYEKSQINLEKLRKTEEKLYNLLENLKSQTEKTRSNLEISIALLEQKKLNYLN